MIEKWGLCIAVVDGKDRRPFGSSLVPNTYATELIEVSEKKEFAIKVKITRDFDWKKCKALQFTATLSSFEDNPAGFTSRPLDDKTTTIFFNTLNNWDKEQETWQEAKFAFESLPVCCHFLALEESRELMKVSSQALAQAIPQDSLKKDLGILFSL